MRIVQYCLLYSSEDYSNNVIVYFVNDFNEETSLLVGIVADIGIACL